MNVCAYIYISIHSSSSCPPCTYHSLFCSCLSITYHPVFLSSCMQPAGSYARVTNMINKIIAGILGDGQEEVTLLQWWRVAP